jgi:septum formation topological specificity factor MinE
MSTQGLPGSYVEVPIKFVLEEPDMLSISQSQKTSMHITNRQIQLAHPRCSNCPLTPYRLRQELMLVTCIHVRIDHTIHSELRRFLSHKVARLIEIKGPDQTELIVSRWM